MFEYHIKTGVVALLNLAATLIYGWLSYRNGWTFWLVAPTLIFAALTGATAAEWWDARRYR